MLYGGRREIEVRVRLDWREEHRMLKLSFPVNAREPKAVYDIPFGFIERPADGGEEHGQQWVDVTGGIDNGGSYGLTLLNDGKYGFDVLDGDLRMTSVRGAGFADHYGERDDLCECMDQGIQEFRYALVPHSGDWRQCNAARKANELNVPPIPVIETFHRGPLPLAYSGIQIKGDGVIVTAFKKAEDGNGYILRFYESKGREVPAAIYVPALNRRFSIDFKPCQIKTFLIPADPDAAVEETNFLEL
jgi:alpha-mannosidase